MDVSNVGVFVDLLGASVAVTDEQLHVELDGIRLGVHGVFETSFRPPD